MAKGVQQQRIVKHGASVAVEQTIATEDSLLPSPKELEAYKLIDENIVPWLLEHTSKEQDHRHQTDKEKIKLLNKAVGNDTMLLILFFIVVLVFIGLCAWFVYLDKNIAGSIFGLFGIIGVFTIYNRFIRKK